MIKETSKCKTCKKINQYKPWLLLFQFFSLWMFIWGCVEFTKWVMSFF